MLAAGALWLPRWWEDREFRQAEAIAGVGSRVLPGKLVDARGRIDAGIPGTKVTAALGQPSFAVKTRGSSTHEIWTYYFSDGTLTVNLTDDYVTRVSTRFGPPRIPQSLRPAASERE